MNRFFPALALALIAGCGAGTRSLPPVPLETTPRTLGEWHLLTVSGRKLVPRVEATPYDLNTPLFSDYAHKLRTIWMPAGAHAEYNAEDVFAFPVGTVFTKTFYYPESGGKLDAVGNGHEFSKGELDLDAVRLIETRILVHREAGWEALPYVWNADETEATLMIAGDIRQLTIDVGGDASFNSFNSFNYVVPNKNECASCHASNHTKGEIEPIGPKARNLNKTFADYRAGTGDQLGHWQQAGLLNGLPKSGVPAAALWEPGALDDLDHRARSYLDVNCGHCHNPVGPADTSGLFLNMAETSLRRLGLCKPPIAAGRGSGGRDMSIYPGDKDKSIMYFRIQTQDPAAMMPEIGRSLVHDDGVALIGAWIDSLPQDCLGVQ